MADTPYGFTQLIVNDSGLSADTLNELQQSGVSHVRIQIAWSVLEPVQGAGYVWTRADNTISQVQGIGLNITFVIQGPPSWHQFSPAGACSGFSYIVAADAAQYALDVMARYGYPGLFGIEVGNEGYSDKPISSAACDDPTLAIPVMQAVWQALKPSYPQLKIGAPATLTSTGRSDPAGNYATTWYTAMAQNGGTQWCNYLNHHHYPGDNAPIAPSNGQLDLPGWTNIAHQAMVLANIQHGYPIVPVYVTETAWTATHTVPPPSGQVSDATQSFYMLEELDIARLSNGIITHVWFYSIGGIVISWPSNLRVAYPNLQAYITQYPNWNLPDHARRRPISVPQLYPTRRYIRR